MEVKKIFIDKLYKNDLPSEMCSVAIPFAKGELTSDQLQDLVLVDELTSSQRLFSTFILSKNRTYGFKDNNIFKV